MPEKNESQGLTELTEEGLARVMAAAIAASRQPTAEEAKKQAEEKARLEQRRLTMVRLTHVEERQKQLRMDRCDHKKPDGEWAVGGQAMSNGREVKICLRCQKVIMNEPTQEMTMAQAELQRLADQGKLSIKDGKVEIGA